MQAGNALSTQATTELKTTIDLFKLVMSITDGQEIENEFADIAEQSAIHGRLSTTDTDLPAYRKFDKVQNVLANAIYPKLLQRWGNTGNTFDINEGILPTDYRKISVNETPPGVDVKTVPPVTTGVMSYHQRSEHVRRVVVGEFGLNTDASIVIRKIRYNAEVMMNKIYVELMNPQILGTMYLKDILEEYYELREVRKQRKLKAGINFDDNHDIDDAKFMIVASFLEMPVTAALSDAYEPLTLSQLIALIRDYYHQMKEIVDAEVIAYRAATDRTVKIVWDAVDKNLIFNIDTQEKKSSHNVHDSKS